MRIGFGYDAHRLVPGRALVLGGVLIPHEKGLLGHSDADALAHAVIDALLGAAGLGDIGRHFPDSDPAYKDISSLKLLERTAALLQTGGYRVANIDCVIVAESPKLSSYVENMERNIRDCLNIAGDGHIVNVKSTTEEGMGFTGSGEGIAAKAVCLLEGK